MRLSQVVKLKRASGILLHPTSLPGGRLGEEAYRFVDWLAAAGQSWWQVLPLGPPDAVGLAVQRRVGVRGLARAARRAAGARDDRRGRGVRRAASVLGRRLGRLRRDETRSPTRFGSSASGLRCATTRASAACASSATSRSTSRREAPSISRTPSSSARRGRRRAAGQLLGDAVSTGAIRCTTGAAHRATGLPLVDRALSPDVRARRHDAHRPLPRLRLLLGDSRSGTGPRGAAAGAAGPGAELFRAVDGELGDCRSSRRTSA